MARQQQEKLAAVTTGSAKSSGIPCAMVLTVSFALSPGTGQGPGFLAPVAARIISAGLSLSVGRPGPRDFAVRISAVRRREQIARVAKASIASRLASCDDRDTPLVPRRDGGIQSQFRKTEGKYFATEHWTGALDSRISIDLLHEIRFFAHAMVWRKGVSRLDERHARADTN